MQLSFALFEAAADVCASVNALAKAGYPPGNISLVARDVTGDAGEQSERRTTIAQALDGLDLAAAAPSLETLALIVIPEEGTFLTAGWPARELTRLQLDASEDTSQLGCFLIGIGCASAEVGFLSGRLQAGTMLLGVQDDDQARLEGAREIFTEQQAIHIGDALLPEMDMNQVPTAPLPDDGVIGDAVVLDIATLVVLNGNESGAHEMIGRALVDETGAEIGPITAVAVDPRQQAGAAPHYVVVRHGGFLGMGSHHYALPAALVTGEAGSDGYQAGFTVDVLENAPAFDPNLPISRREELTICGYYGVEPHWEHQVPAGVAATGSSRASSSSHE